MFFLANHMLAYRPLVAGIGVYNPACGHTGTLGLIATDGVDLWLLSACHILCRADLSPAVPGEGVWQPFGPRLGDLPVARLAPGFDLPALDAAAARLEPGVGAEPRVLGLGRVSPAIDPVVGMRVLKSGIKTGVTEGRVSAVNGDIVTIESPAGFPAKYDLSTIGDSGAVWFEADTLAPVALHNRSLEGPVELAFGGRMTTVLGSLGLAALV